MRPPVRVALVLFLALAAPPVASEEPELAPILDRLSHVADLYARGALGFTCDEVIRYRRKGSSKGRVRYHYIYRRENGRLDDYRISTRIGSSKLHDDEINFPGPAILLRPYSWIFSFRADRQPLNEYRILGTGEVLERPAIRLWVQPRGLDAGAPAVNDWVGEFWIDAETHQLLKVEAQYLDEYRKRLALEEAFRQNEQGNHSVESITTWFGVEEQGIRYPSRVVIERRRYRLPKDRDIGGGRREYRVQQVYSKYRFYRTTTVEEIQQ